MNQIKRNATLVTIALCVSACGAPTVSNTPSAIVTVEQGTVGPENAKPGACYRKSTTPALIETISEQVLLPTASGEQPIPAIYQTQTRQIIVRERQETWVEVICKSTETPQFVATLQRALKARGHYRGPVSGEMDGRTKNAVLDYQTTRGLPSNLLSVGSARELGLVSIGRGEG